MLSLGRAPCERTSPKSCKKIKYQMCFSMVAARLLKGSRSFDQKCVGPYAMTLFTKPLIACKKQKLFAYRITQVACSHTVTFNVVFFSCSVLFLTES